MPGKSSVGSRIAQIRESRGIKRSDLADRAQVEIGMLDNIEDGGLVPSLAPLVRIARVLGVRLGTFLDDSETMGPIVIRSGKAIGGDMHVSGSTGSTHEGLLFHPLASDKAGRHMEPFLIDINTSSRDTIEMSTHEGEEFIFVMTGEVEISYGKETYVLKGGDSIYYDSIVPHHVHTAGKADAKILAVVYAPF
jgi:transcriptional regulator with XRE-family HTH domain